MCSSVPQTNELEVHRQADQTMQLHIPRVWDFVHLVQSIYFSYTISIDMVTTSVLFSRHLEMITSPIEIGALWLNQAIFIGSFTIVISAMKSSKMSCIWELSSRYDGNYITFPELFLLLKKGYLVLHNLHDVLQTLSLLSNHLCRNVKII